MIFASTAVAGLVNRDLLVDIRRQVLGGLTFSTNWLEIRAGTDYFDDTGRSLFVTFWSLAVEEQFYLLWPLLFVGLVAVAATATQRARIALAAAAGSAILMAVLFDPASITRVYYGTDTHAFGLMIGVALGVRLLRAHEAAPERAVAIPPTVGGLRRVVRCRRHPLQLVISISDHFCNAKGCCALLGFTLRQRAIPAFPQP